MICRFRPSQVDDDASPWYSVRWERDKAAHAVSSSPWNACYLIGGGNRAMGSRTWPRTILARWWPRNIFLDFDPNRFGAEKRLLRPQLD